MTSRNFCLTINNPKHKPEHYGKRFNEDCENGRYLIIGVELAPKTGTLHYQCYIELTTSVRFSYIKNNLCRTAHIEERKGSREKARDYCKKDGLYFEFGEFDKGGQGSRSDLFSLHASIKAGASLRDVATKHTREFYKFTRGIQSARGLFGPKRNWETELVIHWGLGGTGKSRIAHEQGGPDAYKLCLLNTGYWWEDYDGEKVVIIDDFDPKDMKRTEFLNICDRYPHRVGNKGGSGQLLANRIIVTSNYDPYEWYGGDISVTRRFTNVTKWGGNTDAPHKNNSEIDPRFIESVQLKYMLDGLCS